MTLHESLKAELKTALKAKDATRLQTIRSILTAFTNELVATNRTPQDTLSDEEAYAVLRRLAKQRRESISQYEAAGRTDLVAPERDELAIIDAYLPSMLSRDDILTLAKAKQSELGIYDKTQLGVLIGAVMKAADGNADGALVKEVVNDLLTAS